MKTLTAFLLLIVSLPAFCQFHHQYQTPNYDWARSVDAIRKGGYVIAGSTLDPGVSWRPFLMRTDDKGVFQWAYLYTLPGIDEHFWDVKSAGWFNDNAFGAIGSADAAPGSLGSFDIYYVFADDVGAPVQARRFGTSEGDVGRHLHDLRHPSWGNGFIVTGYTLGQAGGTGKDIVVLFVNSNGNMTAGRIFRQYEDQDPYWIESTADGGFIVTGRLMQAKSYESGRDAVFLLKLDAFLNLQWYRSYDLVDGVYESDDYAYTVKEVENGNFVVAGTRHKFDVSTTRDAPFLLKTDKNGKSLFVREYEVKGWSSAQGLSLAVNAGVDGRWEYVISGRTIDSFDSLAFKTDVDGIPLWGRVYQDTNVTSKADYIVQNNADGYAMTGLYFNPYNGSSYDAHLIEIDANGKGAASCTNEVEIVATKIKSFEQNKKYNWLDRVQQMTVSPSWQSIPFLDTWCP